MNFKTLNLVTLAFIASAGMAVAQDAQQQTAQVDQAVQQISEDANMIQAALEVLDVTEADVIQSSDPFAGTYKLKSGGFGKARVTVSITPNEDGTYAVQRVHSPKWGDTLSLSGTGILRNKLTMTNKSVLNVTFSNEQGAAGRLDAIASGMKCDTDGGTATARYKLDAEIGRISGVFYAADGGNDDDMDTGAYESGQRVGTQSIGFLARTTRSTKIIVGKIKTKLGLIRNAIAKQLKRAVEAGRDGAHWVRDLLRKVRAKSVEIAKKIAAEAKRAGKKTVAFAKRNGKKVAAEAKRAGKKTVAFAKRNGKKVANGAKKAVKTVRNATADVMDGTADAIHAGAEVVRTND